jgi:hypothetical protein
MSRQTLPVLCVMAGLLGSLSAQAQQDEARALLERAIKAHGGEDKLKASYATHVKAKAKATDGGNEIAVTLDAYFALPDKVKLVMNVEVQGNNISAIVVADGKAVHANIMGKPEGLPDALVKELKSSLYREFVTRLAPLRGKGFKLSPLGEVKIDDKEAVGLQVTHDGKPDMNLYFDKATYLLIKAEYRSIEPGMMQEVDQVRRFSDYKEFGGAKLATRMVMHNDGKKFMELEITELRIVDKHDPAMFGKP